MAKVLFIVRKTKSKKPKNVLYCRVTANRCTREFSTEEIITEPHLWNQDKQLYEKKGREGEYINLVCDKLKFSIKSSYLSLKEGESISPDQVIKKLRAPVQKRYTVAELVQQYIDFEKNHSEKKIKQLHPDTIAHHETYLKNFKEYEVYPMLVTEFDCDEAERFKDWFIKTKGSGRTRPSRHVEFFRKAFDYACKKKLITEHYLKGYEMERDAAKEVVFLTAEEIKSWATITIKNRLLDNCRDLYLYQMCTGVEYSNIWCEFRIQEVPGAGRLITGRRNKGRKALFYLPYDQMAENILLNYNGKLPRIDNSTYNKTLKILAEFLGIDKRLTTHTARKTFTMRMKADGWPMLAIKDMLGHQSSRTTETYYMGASPELVINEMVKRAAFTTKKAG